MFLDNQHNSVTIKTIELDKHLRICKLYTNNYYAVQFPINLSYRKKWFFFMPLAFMVLISGNTIF